MNFKIVMKKKINFKISNQLVLKLNKSIEEYLRIVGDNVCVHRRTGF